MTILSSVAALKLKYRNVRAIGMCSIVALERVKSRHSRKMWSDEEDRLIIQYVRARREGNWHQIAQVLESRSARQCRERYHNYLQLSIGPPDWTAVENALLIELQERSGSRWQTIAANFPGRSERCVKNHWRHLMASKPPMPCDLFSDDSSSNDVVVRCLAPQLPVRQLTPSDDGFLLEPVKQTL
jgi:hypothetical protein